MTETTPDPADVHTGTDRVELTDDERERIIEAIYQGRVRACREKVENWGPPEDEAETHSLLLRVLRGESEGFVANALPVVASIVADRLQALTDERDELRKSVKGRDILSEIEERRTDEAFMERIRNRVADDADLLQRIGEDELFIADVRARLSQAEAERDAARAELAAANTKISKWAEDYKKLAHDCGGTELERQALATRCAELEEEVIAHQVSDAYTKGYEHGTLTTAKFKAERDALQATLDRVTALADEWESEARHWTDQAEAMAGDKRAKSYALASKYQLHADRVRAALTPEGKP